MEGSRSSQRNNGEEGEKINLFLKVIKTVGFSVKTSETVRNVKAILKYKEGIPEHLQELFFTGERLQDDQKLVDCGIPQNATLRIFVQNYVPLRLFVKLPSGGQVIVVEAGTSDTIRNVKSLIVAQEGINSYNFNLIYAGKLLDDDRTLVSLHIQGGSTLHMIITRRDMLTISVKMPTGEILKMDVKMLHTIRDVKTLVESIVGFPVNDLSLTYNGVQLENLKNLSSYNITEESLLEMIPQSIQVFVKYLCGKTITVDAYPEDLVTNVKDKVFLKLRIPTIVQRLAFHGRSLVDNRSLASYNIQKNSTLHLSVWSSAQLPLRLFVRPLSGGQVIVVEAGTSDTIRNVKSLIVAQEGINSYNLKLIYAGKLLHDDRTLASLHIRGGSTLHMIITRRDMLTISVKMPTGEVLKMDVKMSHTICDVKTLVESIVGFPVNDLSLTYNGVQLENLKNLSSYNITEESLLEMIPQSIQVFVKYLCGKTITVDAYPEDLVTNVKDKVFLKLRIPAIVQRLTFHGRSLVDNRSLASYNIQKNSTLHLSVWSAQLSCRKCYKLKHRCIHRSRYRRSISLRKLAICQEPLLTEGKLV